jgi:hypothetical protein
MGRSAWAAGVAVCIVMLQASSSASGPDAVTSLSAEDLRDDKGWIPAADFKLLARFAKLKGGQRRVYQPDARAMKSADRDLRMAAKAHNRKAARGKHREHFSLDELAHHSKAVTPSDLKALATYAQAESNGAEGRGKNGKRVNDASTTLEAEDESVLKGKDQTTVQPLSTSHELAEEKDIIDPADYALLARFSHATPSDGGAQKAELRESSETGRDDESNIDEDEAGSSTPAHILEVNSDIEKIANVAHKKATFMARSSAATIPTGVQCYYELLHKRNAEKETSANFAAISRSAMEKMWVAKRRVHKIHNKLLDIQANYDATKSSLDSSNAIHKANHDEAMAAHAQAQEALRSVQAARTTIDQASSDAKAAQEAYLEAKNRARTAAAQIPSDNALEVAKYNKLAANQLAKYTALKNKLDSAYNEASVSRDKYTQQMKAYHVAIRKANNVASELEEAQDSMDTAQRQLEQQKKYHEIEATALAQETKLWKEKHAQSLAAYSVYQDLGLRVHAIRHKYFKTTAMVSRYQTLEKDAAREQQKYTKKGHLIKGLIAESTKNMHHTMTRLANLDEKANVTQAVGLAFTQSYEASKCGGEDSTQKEEQHELQHELFAMALLQVQQNDPASPDADRDNTGASASSKNKVHAESCRHDKDLATHNLEVAAKMKQDYKSEIENRDWLAADIKHQSQALEAADALRVVSKDRHGRLREALADAQQGMEHPC